MSGERDKMRRILDSTLENGAGLAWVGLVSRDGICVLDAHRRELPREMFSAMTATLMGAAEIALSELGGGSIRRVTAEAAGMTLIVLGASQEFLLVALAEKDAALDAVSKGLQEAVEGVTQALPRR